MVCILVFFLDSLYFKFKEFQSILLCKNTISNTHQYIPKEYLERMLKKCCRAPGKF